MINSTSWGCNSWSLILCILLEIESTDLRTMLNFICDRLIDARVESILLDSAPRLSKYLRCLHLFSYTTRSFSSSYHNHLRNFNRCIDCWFENIFKKNSETKSSSTVLESIDAKKLITRRTLILHIIVSCTWTSKEVLT